MGSIWTEGAGRPGQEKRTSTGRGTERTISEWSALVGAQGPCRGGHSGDISLPM